MGCSRPLFERSPQVVGCTVETLNRFLRQAVRGQGRRPGLTTEVHQRLKVLERQDRELKRHNEILRKSSAHFTLAEPDHHGM